MGLLELLMVILVIMWLGGWMAAPDTKAVHLLIIIAILLLIFRLSPYGPVYVR